MHSIMKSGIIRRVGSYRCERWNGLRPLTSKSPERFKTVKVQGEMCDCKNNGLAQVGFIELQAMVLILDK